MTETTEPAQPPASEKREGIVVVAEETTREGRYIPYGGGSMGWFENSGVLKVELPNNYLFYTEMDSDLVRVKQFERWGAHFNRRGSRARRRKETGVTLVWNQEQWSATTKDISEHGMRLQILEELSLEKNAQILARIHEPGSDKVRMELKARIIWMEKVGRIRPVVNLGLSFSDLSAEDSAKLKGLFADE